MKINKNRLGKVRYRSLCQEKAQAPFHLATAQIQRLCARSLAVSLLSFLLVPETSDAQTSFVDLPASEIAPDGDRDETLGFRQGSFFAVPIPSKDPTVGSGLALVGGYLFKSDEDSDSSFFGLGAYRSTNGSEALGFATNLAFDNNRWKATFIAGRVDLNYDLAVRESSVALRQSGDLASLKLSYGFTPSFSAGLGFRYLDTKVETRSGRNLPQDIMPDRRTQINSIGLLVDWDRRDDTLYPTQGIYVSLAAYEHIIVNSPREYQKAVLTLDGFHPLSERVVIGGRIAMCKASNDAPFFDACALGAVDGFRGFSVTENIGERLLSVQGSLRGRIGKRFGYEIFAGAGQVEDTTISLQASKTRYAGGFGVRYRLSNQFPLDIAVDVTLNDVRDEIVYIRIGQTF